MNSVEGLLPRALVEKFIDVKNRITTFWILEIIIKRKNIKGIHFNNFGYSIDLVS